MKNLLIKIKELKVNNYSRKDDSFDVTVNFLVNGVPDSTSKHVVMNKRAELLSHELVGDIKKFVKDKNKPDPTADFLDSMIIVHYDDDEEIESKVAEFFKRFNLHIKEYKSRGYSEGFLTRYKTPDGFIFKIN